MSKEKRPCRIPLSLGEKGLGGEVAVSAFCAHAYPLRLKSIRIVGAMVGMGAIVGIGVRRRRSPITR